MAFYVVYMWALGVFMFRTRVRSVKSGQVEAKYFKVFAGDLPPDKVVVAGQHYDNQFQVPILFLVTCGLFLALDVATMRTVVLAWAFVATRLAHSWIHLGRNALMKRVAAFAAGWLVILLLWAELVCTFTFGAASI